MSESRYIHGHARAEQDRLVAQAEYWRDDLILPEHSRRAGVHRTSPAIDNARVNERVNVHVAVNDHDDVKTL